MNFFPPPLRGRKWLFSPMEVAFSEWVLQNLKMHPTHPVNELRSRRHPPHTNGTVVGGRQMINENHQSGGPVWNQNVSALDRTIKNQIQHHGQRRRIGPGKCLSKSFSLIMRKTSEPRKAALPFSGRLSIAPLENKNIHLQSKFATIIVILGRVV